MQDRPSVRSLTHRKIEPLATPALNKSVGRTANKMERKDILNVASSLCELECAKGNWDEISHLAGRLRLVRRDDSSLKVKVDDPDFFSRVYWTWSPMVNHPNDLIGVILPFILGASCADPKFPVEYRERNNVLVRYVNIYIDEIMMGLLRWGMIPDLYEQTLRWSTSLPVPHFAIDHYVSFVESDDLKKTWQSLLPLTPGEVAKLDHPTTVIQLQWSKLDLRPELFGVDLLQSTDHNREKRDEQQVASPDMGSDSEAEVSFYKWSHDEDHPILSFTVETAREGFRLKFISLLVDSRRPDAEIEVYLSTHDIISEDDVEASVRLTSVRSEAELSTAILDAMKELGFTKVLITFGGLTLRLPDAC